MNHEIRGYRPVDDHPACRALWVELTDAHRELYDEEPADTDPGAAFEEYLTKLNLAGMWVAVDTDTVLGFASLLIDGDAGELEPLVVTESARREGIGTDLIGQVAAVAADRELSHLTIRPVARNLAALHCLHDAGFTNLSRVTLTRDLRPRHEWRDGVDLHGLRFGY